MTQLWGYALIDSREMSLSFFYRMSLSEEHEVYNFGLIQTFNASKSELLIEDMMIALTDRDKRRRRQDEIKDLIAKFKWLSFKYKNRQKSDRKNELYKESSLCSQRESPYHEKGSCWLLEKDLSWRLKAVYK